MDAGGIDLAILDGEAVPAGGMGIAKQLKDEIYQCPPVLVLTGRPQDAWLATWSRAEAAVPHPLDPIQLAETVVALLRSRVPATTLMTARAGPTSSPRWSAGSRPERGAGRLGDGRDPRRRGDARPRSPASPWRCAPRARRVDEVAGLAAAMLRRGAPAHRAGPAARRRRHRGRPLDVGQHLHDGRDRGGRRRRAAWSSTATARRPRSPAPPTCWRRSASAWTCRSARVAEVADEAGITFCFSAAFHPAMRHAAVPAARARHRHHRSTCSGPLTNPARPRRAGDRLRRRRGWRR